MRVDWDSAERVYDAGLSNGVLYSDEVVPWNGLVSVNETDTGSNNLEHFIDGQRIIVVQESGEFEAALQAFTYPDAFAQYLDMERQRKTFGLSYRTQQNVGDTIHIVYNASIRRSGLSHLTNASVANPSLFEWKIQAASVPIPGMRPVSHVVVNVRESKPEVIDILETWLYGTDDLDPRLPDPEELAELFETHTTLRIRHNGDGTYTASGPDDVVILGDDGTFQINAPTAYLLEAGVFIVDSY